MNIDGKAIEPITICIIGAGGFIGSHICEMLMKETPHKVLALEDEKISALEDEKIGVNGEKIKHARIKYHSINIKDDSILNEYFHKADLIINLSATTCTVYNTSPLDTIPKNVKNALEVVKYCSENNKRLIHFSKDHSLQDPSFYLIKEDIERLVNAEGADNGLEFTIVRPFNWIGPRMDFIPGIADNGRIVPCPLAYNLIRGEPIKLVDGGQSQRTFIYIKDAIEAVLLIIENPDRANGHIFDVGNPNNAVTVRGFAEMMTTVYSTVSGEEATTVDNGQGYDDSEKIIPDLTNINRQLGWKPKTELWDLLETSLIYEHNTFASAVKKAQIEENLKKLAIRVAAKEDKKTKDRADRNAVTAGIRSQKKHDDKKNHDAKRAKGSGTGRIRINHEF